MLSPFVWFEILGFSGLFVALGVVMIAAGFEFAGVLLFLGAVVALVVGISVAQRTSVLRRCGSCGATFEGRPPTCPDCGARQ